MVSISFTGDIAFSKYFKDAWNDPGFINGEIVDFLQNSAYVVANVECPLTGGDVSVDSSLTHASDPKAVNFLKYINANIWSIANNHIMDCGAKGLVDTLSLARENGCATFGAGMNKTEAARPLILNEAGGIGILGVTYKVADYVEATADAPGCVMYTDDETIRNTIRDIKMKNRWCIVIAHAGEEFSSIPLPSVRKQYHKFLEFGADIVVGHHPHVVQNYETVGDKIIFYSLGNFIFDTNYQRIQNHTEFGMLVKLHLCEDSLTWENFPVFIDRKSQKLIPCACPDIFCDITPSEYNKLRPLATKLFFINNKKAHCFSDPEWSSYTAKDWFRHYSGRLGKSAVIRMHIDEYLYPLRLWKFADKKLYTYLLNSVRKEN